MEFLVEFTVTVPEQTPESEVLERKQAESRAAAELVRKGHLTRLWTPPAAEGETKILGLYRAESRAELEGLLGALPLYPWMQIQITALAPHPNDPGEDRRLGTRTDAPAAHGALQPA